MTIDKSLRVRRGATRNRSVLTRVERIARLREADKWSDERSPLGLPKVRVRKMVIKKKKKKKDEEGSCRRRRRCTGCRSCRRTGRRSQGRCRQTGCETGRKARPRKSDRTPTDNFLSVARITDLTERIAARQLGRQVAVRRMALQKSCSASFSAA